LWLTKHFPWISCGGSHVTAFSEQEPFQT